MTNKSAFAGAALGLAALLTSTASAADQNGRFAVRGLGSQPCSVLESAVSGKKSMEIAFFANWLAGYITASNRLIGRTFDAIPSEMPSDLIGLVSVVCRQRPTALVETAAAEALGSINKARLQQDTPLVTMTVGDRSLSVRQEAIQLAQTQLVARGLFKGAADGKVSPALYQAIKTYQRQEKLAESGLLDIDVMIRLQLKNPAR